MHYNRRKFVLATIAMPLITVGLTGCGFQDVKDRIHLARQFVDTINSTANTLSAGSVTQDQKDKLVNLQKQIDQLDDALQKIAESDRDKPGTRDAVSQFITWTNQALAIAVAIPSPPMSPQTKGILVIVQLALLFIQQAFFGNAPSILDTTADPELLAKAKTRFNAASDKDQLALETDKAIKEWLANPGH